MRAVAVQAFGGPEGVAVVDLAAPVPGRGQVLIAVEAIGTGGADALVRRGDLAAYGFREGHVLGGEVAGTVTAVGAVGGRPPDTFGTRLMASFQKSLAFSTFSANTVSTQDKRAVRTAQFATAVRGELTAVVHEQLPLEKAALTQQKMDVGEIFGRIVLIP